MLPDVALWVKGGTEVLAGIARGLNDEFASVEATFLLSVQSVEPGAALCCDEKVPPGASTRASS